MKKIYLFILLMLSILCFRVTTQILAIDTITVGGKVYEEVDSQSDITEGSYVIGYNKNGEYQMLYEYDSTRTAYTRGSNNGYNALELTITSVSNNQYTISYVLLPSYESTDILNNDPVTMYLSFSGTSNGIFEVKEEDVKETTTSIKFTITYDEDKKVTKINSVSNKDFFLNYNEGSSIFRCYKATSNQKDIVLFKYVQDDVCNHSSFKEVSEVLPTCLTSGNTIYYVCDKCEKVFSDKKAQNEIKLEETYLDALGHNYINDVCNRCGKVNVGVTDTLTANMFEASSTTYKNFTYVSSLSGVTYSGNNAMDSDGNIQMKTKNSNSGIVVGESNSNVSTISVKWGSHSETSQLNIYGSNNPYTSVTDLYDETKQGTLIATIKGGDTLEINIDSNYTYIGLRSNSGAIYLKEINITWITSSTSVTDAKESFVLESAQASLLLKEQSDENASSLYSLNVRFGGIISEGSYSKDCEYGVIVLDSAIDSIKLEELNTYKQNQYANHLKPVKVENGYQFGWVINNIPSTLEAYSLTFYVYLYMIVEDKVIITNVSTYTINGIIDSTILVANEYKDLLETLKITK